MTLSAGARLGPYEILSPIGAGGMGEVYRARDTRSNRDVAIKVLPESLATNPDALARFEREAQAVAALSHPNILALHDFGKEGEISYAVMELLDGETLRGKLDGGALPQRRAVEIAVQISHGLAAAHEKGIIHRDLKPDNVFLTKDGRVKILDFGLAKSVARDSVATSAPTSPAGTSPGTVMGTVGYMSPEQVRGREVDQRTDIFSFGAILYEMLSGRRAFKGDSAVETMNAVLKEEPPELAESGRNISPALDRIVRHCLEKSPEARFHSAGDIAFDLESLSGSTSSAHSGVTRVSGFRRLPRVALPILVGAVVLSLVAGFFAGQKLGRGTAAGGVVFQQLTYRRGFVGSARFAPDGQTVVFSAQWDGSPAEIFLKRPDSPEALSLQLPPAEVLAVSSTGQMAIALDCRIVHNGACAGTLALVPITGGAPRRIEDGIQWVDWTPDGSAMALVHDVGGHAKLEFPPGKIIYETDGHISWPRFSPDGKKLAFLDHPLITDDLGTAAILDLASGKIQRAKPFESVGGLAWSPSGDEVWFTAADSGSTRALRAVSLSGRLRTISSVPGGLTIRDIAKNGRVLISHDNVRKGIMGTGPGASRERELSWLEWSIPTDLSDDGSTLLFTEQGQAVGANYVVCLRKTDGSPVVQLGPGNSISLSPDGAWVLSRPAAEKMASLTLLPTGTGQPRKLPTGNLGRFGRGLWLRDGRRLLFSASEQGKPRRVYLEDIEGSSPRPLSPADFDVTGFGLGPDGESFILPNQTGKPMLWPVDGGPPHEILPGLDLAGLTPIRWSKDGRSLFARATQGIPAAIYRVDVANGHRTLVRQVSPGDPAGLLAIGRIMLSEDASAYAYGYTRALSDLFVAEGMK